MDQSPDPRQAEAVRRLGRHRLMAFAWVAVWAWMTGRVVLTALARHSTSGVVGALAAAIACVALCVVWFRSFRLVAHGNRFPDPLGWASLAVGLLATAATVAALGAPGLEMVLFSCVALAFALPWQWSLGPILLAGAGMWWSQSWFPGLGPTHGEALGTLGSSIGCLFGRIATERGEVTRRMSAHAHQMELNDERNRMARDLHDILGHSLTVITLKTELASKLMDVDPEAAKQELAEVQSLSRSALADVRATVNNYRELSLAGELARAANTLASAGIKAELPLTVDAVDPELRELFAWGLREGITNVVRHAEAQHCRVALGATSLSVLDDGRGVHGPSDGHGISGLRQRCEASGVGVELRPGPRGVGTELVLRARDLSAPALLVPGAVDGTPTRGER